MQKAEGKHKDITKYYLYYMLFLLNKTQKLITTMNKTEKFMAEKLIRSS